MIQGGVGFGTGNETSTMDTHINVARFQNQTHLVSLVVATGKEEQKQDINIISSKFKFHPYTTQIITFGSPVLKLKVIPRSHLLCCIATLC